MLITNQHLKMPLDSEPPPSPVGKTPPSKHFCPSTMPCRILLSDVGKHYHGFPKGTFCSCFAPPAVPRSVLRYLSTYPPSWSWTTKAGPNAGKSFNVLSVPTSCGKDSPRVIQWIISIFHAFKSQLAPPALDAETGRVLPGFVCIYQNNMLLHFRLQQAQSRLKPPTLPKASSGTPPPPTSVSAADFAELKAELMALQAEFEALKRSLGSQSSDASSSSPSLSLQTAPTVLPANHPPPTPTSTMSSVQESTSHPQHSLLQLILNNECYPPLFKHIDSSMVPIYSHSIPNDVQAVLNVQYPKGSPRFMGFDSNGDLWVSAQAPHELIQMVLWATPQWPLPPPIPTVFK